MLSPRIQRRINLATEAVYKNQKISKLRKEGYLPPCYWCSNAFGNEDYSVEDKHPFADARGRMQNEFDKIPPLKYELEQFSLFSWNFKLGYAPKGSTERYVTPAELERRTEEYLTELEREKSIVFFYVNYSNPITGDDYPSKYLLLGAGLLRDVKAPQEYDIPDRLVKKVQAQKRMGNFPKLAWQFQIMLDPSNIVILPYHEYLDLIEKDELDLSNNWTKLDQVAVRIEDETIIPHFKYVSMQLPHDKSIYLLYMLRQSIKKMSEHEFVKHSELSKAEKKIDSFLSIAWKLRGRYPGFRNALYFTLKADFDADHLRELIPKFEKYIVKSFGSVEDFLDKLEDMKVEAKAPADFLRAQRIVSRKAEELKFLSLFDLSIKEFENVGEIVSKVGLKTAKSNPYVLLENYHHDLKDTWNVDETDYGIGLYHIDIALIPDPKYADWDTLFDARSPERLRALVMKILYDTARHNGNSYSTRDEIVENIQRYPLYYIIEKLKIDVNILLDYEKQPIFKEKFLITEDLRKNEVRYQLKSIREIENVIEQFTEKMLRKKYTVDPKIVEEIVRQEREVFKDKLDADERVNLYNDSLENGLFALSGKAGSGKTHAVVNLITTLRQKKKLPIFVLTPTGKANLVIRNRLKKLGLHKESSIQILTIHRFLYGALYKYFLEYPNKRGDISRLQKLISKLLSFQFECLDEFRKQAKNWTFNPRVVIIDEASMVDQVLLATFLSLINPDALEHLILVGDERQLPPIGMGRPFTDLIFNLKQKGLEKNFVHLESNLRFDPGKRLGVLSDLFSGHELPSLAEVNDILTLQPPPDDDSLEVDYFSSDEELKSVLKKTLGQIVSSSISKPLFEVFTEIFETGADDTLNLDKVQIISPRRVGSFGSMAINRNTVLNGDVNYPPKTKLICENNMYFSAKGSRILGLANGSIGYIKSEGYVHFDDIEELFEDYPAGSVMSLVNRVRKAVYNSENTEQEIDFAYAITVHKSQGSDFEHVVLVLSQISPFITRELLYTAFTRPREKLHLIVHKELKSELATTMLKAYANSLVEQRKTLLFGYKTSPFKPYRLTLKDGTTIDVDSKIERIVAGVLDKMDIGFEHGPMEFYAEHHVIPDFKLSVNGKTFYIEHLGRMDDLTYRERWLKKLEIYKKLGIAETLVTTTESKEKSNVEESIKKIVDDMKADKLRKTEGYSYHHYEI